MVLLIYSKRAGNIQSVANSAIQQSVAADAISGSPKLHTAYAVFAASIAVGGSFASMTVGAFAA